MGARHFYVDSITGQEQAAGFRLINIANLDAEFYGQFPTIRAVVYPHSESYRVVKFRDPDGSIEYQLQEFGLAEETGGTRRIGSVGRPAVIFAPSRESSALLQPDVRVATLARAWFGVGWVHVLANLATRSPRIFRGHKALGYLRDF